MQCPTCFDDNLDTALVCQSCGGPLAPAQGSGAVVSLVELPSGTLLKQGEYQLKGTLGQGGFGITYSAIQCRTNQSVACQRAVLEREP
jgi:eukaryotic-like serine/threonine-protein kinase